MNMMRTKTTAAIMICLTAAYAPLLLAQGKSGGFNRALSAAAKGSSASGLAKATGKSSNATNRVLRSGSAFGRTANGLQRANATLDSSTVPTVEVPAAGPALDNPQRILDQRLQQADHLRALSESNGNQHLLDTADRMQANATTNFERQQLQLNPTVPDPSATSTTTPTPPTTSAPPSVSTDTQSAPLTGTPQTRTRRGFWFRSR
jgi:hypothetical protein